LINKNKKQINTLDVSKLFPLLVAKSMNDASSSRVATFSGKLPYINFNKKPFIAPHKRRLDWRTTHIHILKGFVGIRMEKRVSIILWLTNASRCAYL